MRFGNKSKLRWQRKPNSLGIHQNRKVAGRSRHRAIWVVYTYYTRWFDSPRMAFSYLDWCCNYVRHPSDAYGHKTLQRPTRSIKNQRLLALRSRDKWGGTKQPHPPNLCYIERYPSGDGTALIRRQPQVRFLPFRPFCIYTGVIQW